MLSVENTRKLLLAVGPAGAIDGSVSLVLSSDEVLFLRHELGLDRATLTPGELVAGLEYFKMRYATFSVFGSDVLSIAMPEGYVAVADVKLGVVHVTRGPRGRGRSIGDLGLCAAVSQRHVGGSVFGLLAGVTASCESVADLSRVFPLEFNRVTREWRGYCWV